MPQLHHLKTHEYSKFFDMLCVEVKNKIQRKQYLGS